MSVLVIRRSFISVSFIVLKGVSRFESNFRGFRVQILDLKKHHTLLALCLSPQLLHLNVYVTVDFLK
jgi:hypothetical protein